MDKLEFKSESRGWIIKRRVPEWLQTSHLACVEGGLYHVQELHRNSYHSGAAYRVNHRYFLKEDVTTR